MVDITENPGLVTWDELGDINSARPNLGQVVSVPVYRSLMYSIRHVLTTEFDSDFANAILYKAGKFAGEKFCQDFLDIHLSLPEFLSELKQVLLEKKICILRIEKADPDRMEFLLTAAEDLDCSGLPFIDMVVCKYDEGFFAGIMRAYTGKDFAAKEVDCWGMGDRVCRFLVSLPQ